MLAFVTRALLAFIAISIANAHLAVFHEAMYCLNGPQKAEDLNSQSIVNPLFGLEQNQWWLHGVDRCNQFPPAPGKFLNLPAGGSFVVEIASNRAKTFTAYGGRYASAWPDGGTYPENYNVPSCIIHPNMHTQNRSMAAGTAFAISYTSNINEVRPDNLVVFSVLYNSPWKREARYEVPSSMPPCPEGGCICAWGWIPNGCGQPNMYHQAIRCRVTGSKSNTPIGRPKPPVWCEGNPNGCTKGPKQMLYWNQKSGNNIRVDGRDLSGHPKSPAYNAKCGFSNGAQNDIFASPPSSDSTESKSRQKSQPPATDEPVSSSEATTPKSTPSASSTNPLPSTSRQPQNAANISNTELPNAPVCSGGAARRRRRAKREASVHLSTHANSKRSRFRQTLDW